MKSALYRVYFTNGLPSLLSGRSDAMALWVDSGQRLAVASEGR